MIFIGNNCAHESPYSDSAVRTVFFFFFTCKGLTTTPSYGTVLPWHVRILAEKQKITIQRARYKNHKSLQTNSHAGIRDKNKVMSCQMKTNQTQKAAMHHLSTWEHAQLLWQRGGRRATKRQIYSVVLCCEAYHALTANKPSACASRLEKKAPRVLPDQTSSLN